MIDVAGGKIKLKETLELHSFQHLAISQPDKNVLLTLPVRFQMGHSYIDGSRAVPVSTIV